VLGVVLIVDDEPLVRRLMQRYLTDAGYRVFACHNAAEALPTAKQLGESLNLLLCDIVLPDCHGEDLAEAIEHLCPKADVLLISGRFDGNETSRYCLLAKPFTRTELLEKVAECMRP
jgi:DNA-binding NtrC family response regulator